MVAKRQVFLNCNENGVIPVSIAVYSLLKSADPSRPLTVFLAHNTAFERVGGCTSVRSVVARFPFADVRFANFDPILERHRETLTAPKAKWPLMVWAWCFCTELFPNVTGNLVFIDWDMYVLKDLEPLYALDLKTGNYVTAAVNESRREHRPYLVAAGWPDAAGYAVNTGTQVIDTDTYRRDGICRDILSWYARHKDVSLCVEQDAINAVAGERILRLPITYNFTVGWCDRLVRTNPFRKEVRVYPVRDVFVAVADPAILHFIGHKKPWRWNHRPFRNRYRKAMEELGLFDPKTFGETLPRRVIGALFDVYHLLIRAYARLILATVLRSRRQSA